MTTHKTPTLLQAFIPIIFLILLLSLNVGLFGSDALGGSNQLVLILSGAIAAIIAFRLGCSWGELQKGIVKTISSAMGSILILLLIGSLAGTWLLSGVVPAMIYYGLQILNPTIFLFAACIICSVVSIATGSSWTTAATVGIALIGIGVTLGIPVGWVAGAILSGAYFGDKMSPLSDTTNLAPAMAGTDLFTHIRYMAITTVPSIVLALMVFLVVGFTQEASGSMEEKHLILDAIGSRFNISGWLFIVPLVVIMLIIRKIAALPALFIGTLLGVIFAFIFQPNLVMEVGQSVGGDGFLLPDNSGNRTSYMVIFMGVMQTLFGGISFDIGIEKLDASGLLSAAGMSGMLNTIWLIISAMIFGGVMETAGFLKCIAQAIISKVHSTSALIASTAGTCMFFNIVASDQYMAIVVPGRMYANTFKKKGLAPENLSRTLEDSGTVTSVLVPWNTCGAYHAGVLSVATIAYLPYCIFNIVSPLMTVLVAYVGYNIVRSKKMENNYQRNHQRVTAIRKLPIVQFSGRIHLVDTPEKSARALTELQNENRLGFDTETKPTFIRGDYNHTTLVQLSTRTDAYLFQLKKIGFVDELKILLENQQIEKLGVSTSDDLKELHRISPFKPAGFTDLAQMAKENDIPYFGLQKLTAFFLGQRLSKSQQVSNWENSTLTKSQQVYAATDAWVALEIHDGMRRLV